LDPWYFFRDGGDECDNDDGGCDDDDECDDNDAMDSLLMMVICLFLYCSYL
jgi:hypothetical protein